MYALLVTSLVYINDFETAYTDQLTDFDNGYIGLWGRDQTQFKDIEITPITKAPTVDPTTVAPTCMYYTFDSKFNILTKQITI